MSQFNHMVQAMSQIERNNRIIALRAQGHTIAAIAGEFSLSGTGVRRILQVNRLCITDTPVPPEISVRTAHLTQESTGLWPSDETAAEINERWWYVFRSPGVQMKNMDELSSWLLRLGIKPNQR